MRYRKRLDAPWLVMGATIFLAFTFFIPLFCIPPIEDVIRETLSISYAQTGFLFTGAILMMVLMAIPGGIIADRIGIKKAVSIGTLVLVIGALSRAFATDYSALLAFTLVYGVGLGLVFPNLPKVVSASVPREKAGIGTGLYSAGFMTGAGLAIAITVPLILPVTGTIQGVFLIWSIPTIAAAVLWWIVATLHSPRIVGNASEVRYSLTLRSVLRSRNLWLVAILLLLHNFFFYTWAGWAPLLLRQSGATPELAGAITSLCLWIGIPVVLLVPRVAYRLGVRKPFIWGASIVMAVAALGAMYNTLALSWFLMLAVGVANAIRVTTILALPVEMTSREMVGIASGLVISVGYVGGLIGPLVGGYILELTGSLQGSMIILILVSVGAALISFALPETGARIGKTGDYVIGSGHGPAS
jgi:CP family cyanate transporter-like MFS transporter